MGHNSVQTGILETTEEENGRRVKKIVYGGVSQFVYFIIYYIRVIELKKLRYVKHVACKMVSRIAHTVIMSNTKCSILLERSTIRTA